MKTGKKTKYRGIKRLKDGRFRIRVYWIDGSGREREAVRTVRADSVEHALAKQVELRKRMRHGAPGAQRESPGAGSPEPRPFGEVAKTWLEEITTRRHDEDPAQYHLCPSSKVRYRLAVNDFIVPFMGELSVDALSAQLVREWRNNLVDAGYKRATINGHLRILKILLRSIGREDAAKVPELRETDQRINRKAPNMLTADELDRFLREAEAHWPQHFGLILVLFTTTLRIGTALALRWEDLDLEEMQIVVCRRLSEREVVPGVKGDRFGEDTPPLLPEVLEALERCRREFNPAQRDSGLLFPARSGRHHDRSVLRKAFADILLRAEIKKRFTPHGCRRTGAKLYGRTAGTQVGMAITGHRTERMFAHYTPTDAKEKQEAARLAFRGLRLVSAGREEEVDPDKTGT